MQELFLFPSRRTRQEKNAGRRLLFHAIYGLDKKRHIFLRPRLLYIKAIWAIQSRRVRKARIIQRCVSLQMSCTHSLATRGTIFVHKMEKVLGLFMGSQKHLLHDFFTQTPFPILFPFLDLWPLHASIAYSIVYYIWTGDIHRFGAREKPNKSPHAYTTHLKMHVPTRQAFVSISIFQCVGVFCREI